MPEQIWFKDPAILFTQATWNKFVPIQGMTTAESLNSVVRFSVYFALLLFAATGVSSYMLSVPVVMIATVFLYSVYPNGTKIEAFISPKVKGAAKYTMPTDNNPFMNVLLTEIQDDPNRPDAAPVNRRDVKAQVYKKFQSTSDIYMDTSDLFDQAQAMRTFATLQSSTIPNNLDDYKKFLAKGIDEPDYSSAPPARHAKILSETHIVEKGSMKGLSSSISKPSGTSPSSASSTTSTKATSR